MASKSSPAKRRSRSRAFLDRIESNPDVCGGRPCIKGTRIRVSDVVDMVAEGATTDEIVADYPYLSAEDIAAALNTRPWPSITA